MKLKHIKGKKSSFFGLGFGGNKTDVNETKEPDWTIPDYNMMGETVELDKGKFYKEHVSQSLPAILRGDCLEWDMKKDLDAVIMNDT